MRAYDIFVQTQVVYLYKLMHILKHHSFWRYTQLVDLVIEDSFSKEGRFLAHYLLLSFSHNSRLTIATYLPKGVVDSVTGIFRSAEWAEREAWDLFGIHFNKHKDLRRILTDYGFLGHPLRKDFPLTGFYEMYYSEIESRVMYLPVSLSQEYRNFTFANPWGTMVKKINQ